MTSDPNFKDHLPSLMQAGLRDDRPDPDLGQQLRKRYKDIIDTKKKAATVLKTANPELAAELEELAEEMAETTERFAAVAINSDGKNRPDPDLPHQLREAQKYKMNAASIRAEKYKSHPDFEDPNFDEHLPDMMKVGSSADRPDYELPRTLRMLKQSSTVEKRAAVEIRPLNAVLAEELSEIAEEIDESHDRFVAIAEAMKDKWVFSEPGSSS